MEFLSDKPNQISVRFFGSDIKDSSIKIARSGIYPVSIEKDVSTERLERFFNRVEGGYQVKAVIRDLCVFAKQNVTSDPPFSKIDFISCRNFLIYISPLLQKKVVLTFHYALNTNGFLLLGPAENVSEFREFFDVVNQKAWVYSRRQVQNQRSFEYVFAPNTPEIFPVNQKQSKNEDFSMLMIVQREADRVAMAKYEQPAVVINEAMEILQFRGDTSFYLKQAHGTPTLNLLKMAQDAFRSELRDAVNRVSESNAPFKKENIRIKDNLEFKSISIEVIPLRILKATQKYFLVVFSESPRISVNLPKKKKLSTLEEELIFIKAHMQSVIEEREAQNGELQAANEEIITSNEELQSLNEEMQSANEELQTAKEELQASNEELTTVNDELNNRNMQLSKLNDDFVNITTSIQLPIVIVGKDYRIQFFTPAAEKIFSLVSTDIGRPLRDIKQKILISNLEGLVSQVMEELRACEQEIMDIEGIWYNLKVQLYKTSDNKITGAILEFSNIDALKRNQKLERKQHEEFNKIVRQANHDIASPLAALEIFFGIQASVLPEEQRVAIRTSLDTIKGIVSSMLLHFKTDSSNEIDMSPIKHTQYDVLLLPALLDVIQEKKFEYRNIKINICEDIDEKMYFALVRLDPWDFKRMMSNIINNSVNALSLVQKPEIVIGLGSTVSKDSDKVCITVSDNGVGMPAFVKKQILNDLPVTSIKRQNDSVGYTQIREMLRSHKAKLEVESVENVGTKIILTFSTLKLPPCIVSEIELYSGDTVIVLDDDPSIHAAWDLRFIDMMSSITLKHFTQGQDAVKYINDSSQESKQHMFLLADYELLNQEIDGIDVINRVELNRAILVTGHYFNQELISAVKSNNIKMLPKVLAPKVPITFRNT